MDVHDGSAVMLVGQVAVLLDELLEVLLEEPELGVEDTALLVLLVLLKDSEVP